MSTKYLDDNGLLHFWERIRNRLNKKQDKLVAGDGIEINSLEASIDNPDYIALTYLQSSGSGYIETSIVPLTGLTEYIEVEYDLTDDSGDLLMPLSTSTSIIYYKIIYISNSLFVGIASKPKQAGQLVIGRRLYWSVSVGSNDGVKETVEISVNNYKGSFRLTTGSFSVNGTDIYTFNNRTPNTTDSLSVFGYDRQSSYIKINNIEYCRRTTGGSQLITTETYYLIPALQVSDNSIGLYATERTMDRRFYTPNQPLSFVAGEEKALLEISCSGISDKADKVSDANSGDIAVLDEDGNLATSYININNLYNLNSQPDLRTTNLDNHGYINGKVGGYNLEVPQLICDNPELELSDLDFEFESESDYSYTNFVFYEFFDLLIEKELAEYNESLDLYDSTLYGFILGLLKSGITLPITINDTISGTMSIVDVNDEYMISFRSDEVLDQVVSSIIIDFSDLLSEKAVYSNINDYNGYHDTIVIPIKLPASYVDIDTSDKADKVSDATSGNFAGLDSNGNLTDSGKNTSDFISMPSTGSTGQVLKKALDGVEWANETTELPSITGNGGKVLKVNSSATGVEWATAESGGGSVSDVTINSTSIVSNGTAEIETMTTTELNTLWNSL